MLNIKSSTRALMIAAVMTAAACGGSGHDITAPSVPSVSGTWIGTYSSVNYDGTAYSTPIVMTLTDRAGSVTGLGTFGVGTAETYSGTFAAPNISILIHDQTSQDAIYTATVSGNIMRGQLNGSGFANDPLTMTRQ